MRYENHNGARAPNAAKRFCRIARALVAVFTAGASFSKLNKAKDPSFYAENRS